MVGVVTMDQTMVRVPDDVPVQVGDEVVLIGRQGDEEITATELAGLAEHDQLRDRLRHLPAGAPLLPAGERSEFPAAYRLERGSYPEEVLHGRRQAHSWSPCLHRSCEQVDGLAALERTDRDALIREAVRIYVEERKKRDMREQMRRGYREMSRINLTLAEEGPIFERIGSLP